MTDLIIVSIFGTALCVITFLLTEESYSELLGDLAALSLAIFTVGLLR